MPAQAGMAGRSSGWRIMLPRYSMFGPEAVAPGRQEANCPVFTSLMAMMDKMENPAVLDLGPACAANLELLSRFRCKLFIEDVHDLIESFTGDAPADEAILKNWLGQWTAGTAKQSIDVVLAWDIFNYLEPGPWKIFTDHLTPLLKTGAPLYLLVYTQRDMPALPMQFKAIGLDKLEYRPHTGETRPSPRFNQTELKRRLQNFSVTKSVLLRNGIQEYLLKRTA